jgi:hypothetical protein
MNWEILNQSKGTSIGRVLKNHGSIVGEATEINGFKQHILGD